ncbi:MAG TPA: hypothetical protein VFS76_09035 [Pyrinomonadaceae bacterium]|nr:hypothetical protein [Pyrinomonadaceae bacterium]
MTHLIDRLFVHSQQQSTPNRVAREQLSFKYNNLRVDDAIDVQLTAARKGVGREIVKLIPLEG